ncbi:hypothetical protein EII38_02395 [Streptococcus minor]|uniref:Uncharacterized protein n=1 Tax=Streptococcus minor TaxID=229549 RepID=A0A3P1VFY7_9STRE|nr:hypothetical protein [Streptococcus minor]RRD32608.1 hypothetical protein EII38_02395 [Streptococcus minor]
MKKALTSGFMSFIFIYATCILFGPVSQDLAKTIFQYFSWSLPASVIIGILTYRGICKDTTR